MKPQYIAECTASLHTEEMGDFIADVTIQLSVRCKNCGETCIAMGQPTLVLTCPKCDTGKIGKKQMSFDAFCRFCLDNCVLDNAKSID